MVSTNPQVKPAASTAAPPAATAAARQMDGAEQACGRRGQKAYKLTDKRGNRAYAWRVDRRWVVKSDDPALQRRITRALQKPLWVTEDVLGEDGCWWSTRVLLQPDEPRYATRLLFRWGQIGLGALDVELVPLAEIDAVREEQPAAG